MWILGPAQLELVDRPKFCYLGYMLSVDGDADAAVEARIRSGWNKFRQLGPLLTNKDVSLIMRGVFLLVPAYPGCPGPKAVKRLCVVCVCAILFTKHNTR